MLNVPTAFLGWQGGLEAGPELVALSFLGPRFSDLTGRLVHLPDSARRRRPVLVYLLQCSGSQDFESQLERCPEEDDN